ncbi:SURF1 family protein [Paraglaciecola aquimarina]|uniref:SURF1-like protein n=1 Tax=Paraglaciecola algarum TaxID=3050085 RepID=A0ABS9DC25_9ALTE|nr:SURF1 family protein [Paraglaciecola sp. G1-23]
MNNKKYRLPVLATLITFLAVVIMFALGVWQLQRAEQKQLRLDSIAQAKVSSPLGLKEVLHDLENMVDMPLSFNAKADIEHYFLLDNKIHQGRVGYQVLVPLKTNQGVVMTNFGWVSATHSREVLPSVVLYPELVKFSGIVSFPTKNAMVTETAKIDGNWPKVLQAVDLKVIQQHYKQSVLPLVVKLAQSKKSGFVRNWQPVVMPPEKHLAYAVQWFLLGIAALVVFVIAQRKKIIRNECE